LCRTTFEISSGNFKLQKERAENTKIMDGLLDFINDTHCFEFEQPDKQNFSSLFWINQRLNSIYGIDIRRRILNIRERCFPHQNNLIFDSCILNSTTERRVRNFI